MHTGSAAAPEGWTYRNIYLARSLVQATVRQLDWPGDGLPWFRHYIGKSARAWIALDRLFRVFESQHPRLETDSILLMALRVLFEEYGNRRPGADEAVRNIPAVGRARQYLSDRYRDEVLLDELADAAGVSPCYLIRCFQKELGLSPTPTSCNFVSRVPKQTSSASASLAEIAIRHGFFDQSHFDRNFKRAFGVTPSQYRKGNSVQYIPGQDKQ